MIKTGMLIADRYEIVDKIGTGGMSDVYKAKDIKLNRFVAIKVLKQEFSENKNFVSKFRVEAQAAAGLMHPNIVNVYDVGEENTIHYIVMELVEGITLKKYIEKKVRLSTKEAISIAIQVAMGIEAAHNNHIIHRDIKPQNIIISKEGKVKVTDFGIAKAASSNTITSNVMGSVHYTSPEQARGGFSDEKSDIYSMGITFFEMLTGRVPFNGDTTVAIAIKHIQDEMPSPKVFVPETPVSVESIVLKCTQKNPDRRYQNMGEMISDLKRSLINPDENFVKIDSQDETGKTRVVMEARGARAVTGSMAKASAALQENYGESAIEEKIAVRRDGYQEPPVREDEYAYQQENYRQDDDREPIYEDDNYAQEDYVREGAYQERAVRTSTRQEEAPRKKKPATPQSNPAQKKNTSQKRPQNQPVKVKSSTKKKKAAMAKKQGRDRQDSYTEKDYDYNPRQEQITTILTVLAAIVIGCIFLYFAGQAVGIFSAIGEKENSSQQESVERAQMPTFEGVALSQVKEAMQSAGLGSKTVYEESAEYGKDIVISAALESGEKVLAGDQIIKNTTIILTVSAGADGVKVPDVLGDTEAEGTAKLTKEGFQVLKTDAYSDEYAKGTIMEQSVDGGSIAALETQITIVISKGNENVEVRIPEALGRTIEEATSILEEAGLVLGKIEDTYSSEYPEGQICYQSYSVGTTVSQGTVVDLRVSIGAETITYSCNLTIQAPRDYLGGNAEVILTTADGTQQLWYSEKVTSFPLNININNFPSTSAYGVVIITYLKNVEEIVTDADGNQSTQVTQALAQVTQNVQFTKE